MVNHQTESGETIRSSRGLKHTWQSSPKLRKILQYEFNSEEIEKLKNLLGSLEKSSKVCSLALSSKPSFPFCMNVLNKFYANSWIIDYSAIDHMTTTTPSTLPHFYPMPEQHKSCSGNRSLATIAGFREIHATPAFALKNVLHVPKLSASLVFIQKLIHDLKCYAIFSPPHYVFQ
jgi:hypothetical protein